MLWHVRCSLRGPVPVLRSAGHSLRLPSPGRLNDRSLLVMKVIQYASIRKEKNMPTRMMIQTPPPQLTHARRLIIASNRGPIEYQLLHDKSLKARRGSGGMVTALIDVSNSMDVTWVAMAMTEGDRQAVQQAKSS